jgi:hypothetical protein
MSERLSRTVDRISDFLVRMDIDPDRDEEGLFLVRWGSTVVILHAFEDGTNTYVRMASTLLSGVRPQLELVMRIFRLNTEVLFGAFLLFEDDTLAFTHTLPADRLELETFAHVLRYVAKVSDDHDEELQALAGGLRAEDVLQDGDAR